MSLISNRTPNTTCLAYIHNRPRATHARTHARCLNKNNKTPKQVIDHLIRAKIKDGGSELDDRTELGKHICKRMPLHNQARLQSLYDAWVVYWRAPSQQQAQQQEQQRRLKLRIRRRRGQIKTRVDGTAGGVASLTPGKGEGLFVRGRRVGIGGGGGGLRVSVGLFEGT